MPSEDAATSTGEAVPVRSCPAQRAHSDSSVPSCRTVNAIGVTAVAGAETSTKSLAPCTCGDHKLPIQRYTANPPLLQRVKARHDLQLPSFRSLGIAAGAVGGPSGAVATGALPTPPEETSMSDLPLAALPPDQLSRSLSYTEGILPTTPVLHEYWSPRFTKVVDGPARDMPEQSSSATPTVNPATSTSIACDSKTSDQKPAQGGTGGQEPPGKSGNGGDADDNGFVVGAISFTSEYREWNLHVFRL